MEKPGRDRARDSRMTKALLNLMDVLAGVNQVEYLCKKLDTVEAVPPRVYELLGHLMSEVVRWGEACRIIEENQNAKNL